MSGGETRIVLVSVPKYKNLEDVWVPWSDGLALIGANGAGKTNLLEVLAALMGTPETLERIGRRVDWDAVVGSSVTVRRDFEGLPTPYTDELKALKRKDWDESPYDYLFATRKWWRTTGSKLASRYPNAWNAAVVRYELAAAVEHDGVVERTFRRTLLLGGEGDEFEVELPHSTAPPVDFQWLPAIRSSNEAEEALEKVFVEALPNVTALVDTLGENLPTSNPPRPGDAHWWLHEVATNAAREELALTCPAVSVESDGGSDASWWLLANDVRLGWTRDDAALLERMSSGQRRWADEALATMARTMRTFGARARLHTLFFSRLEQDDVSAVVTRHLDLDARITGDGYWAAESLSTFLGEVESRLIDAAQSALTSDLLRRQLRELVPELQELEARVVVRVFDEPEAHLHPLAQRQVAAALDSMRVRGTDVVVASHSPAFLNLPDWHVLRVAEGKAEPVEGLEAPAQTAVARDLGVTRGELLAGIAALLVVEGDHDLLFLQRMFGTDLRGAGVAVARMFGTNGLLSVVELDFLLRYVQVPPIVMLDYTSGKRVELRRPKTSEEKKAVAMLAAAEERGLVPRVIPLRMPDIVCYVHEDVVREVVPEFPGWEAVYRAYKSAKTNGKRPSFKPWLRSLYGVDLGHEAQLTEHLDRMDAYGLRPEGELVRKINELVAELVGPMSRWTLGD